MIVAFIHLQAFPVGYPANWRMPANPTDRDSIIVR
jgi:hypothetical protein